MYLLAQTIDRFAMVIYWLILVRVIMSWVARDRNNQVVQFIYQVTEPILAPFRELLNRLGLGGTLDFSPILAMITIQFVARTLVQMLLRMG